MDSGLFDVAFLLVFGFGPLAAMAVCVLRQDRRQNRKLPYLWKTAGHRAEGVLK